MATFMELLERFVAAHEKQADAAMLLAENSKHECGCKRSDVSQVEHEGEVAVVWTKEPAPVDTTGVPMEDLADAIASTVVGQAVPDMPTAAGWNPYTSPLQKVYRKPLAEVLDTELARLGIDPGDKLTGAQKHQLLLDHATKGSIAAAPAAPAEAPAAMPAAPAAAPMPAAAPTEPPSPVVPTAPAEAPASYDEVKARVYELFAKDQQMVKDLLIKYAGCQKLVDAATGSPTVPQGQWANLMAEVNAALQGA